jgi:3-phosphoshikimate 1-carboxyvinyltransferase
MGDGLAALERLGAVVDEHAQPGHLPVTISAGEPAASSEARLRADVSSQFVSGLLLSAPARRNGLVIRLDGEVVSRPYLDLTIGVMAAFGVAVDQPDERTFVVPAAPYRATTYAIEPDASAASYFFAAPVIAGGRVRVLGLGRDALQGDVRFVDVLEQMGATVERADDHIEVRSSGRLRGVTADLTDFSDTAQTLATTAVHADSPTTVTGIGFIRRKETDRVAAVVTELRRCGIEAVEDPDGWTIVPGTPVPATVRTYDDHRMAMSFALLGLRAPGIEIADPGCVAKTFPTFWAMFDSLRTGGNA